jgi:transcriptional regulator NrdR family protein
MRCLYCGSDTRIVKSREISDGYAVSRTRACDGPLAHRFTTREGSPTGQDINRLAVRQSGSGELSASLFDIERLIRDVEIGVLGRLTSAQVRDVVDDTVATLERRSDHHEITDRGEQARFPTATAWVSDRDVASEIERQLQTRNRMSMVLYALSTEGRRDRPGRDGWADAGDVLRGLGVRFKHLDVSAPPRIDTSERPQRWSYPGVAAPRPDRLVKRSRGDELRQKESRFNHEQFKRSIRHALAGRFDPEAREQKVDLIAEWTLWGLAGQEVIFTSQLALGVLDCLRRIDDVAYLRWVAILKGIESVSEFAAEARGLVTYPSPRLKLVGPGVPGRPAGATT